MNQRELGLSEQIPAREFVQRLRRDRLLEQIQKREPTPLALINENITAPHSMVFSNQVVKFLSVDKSQRNSFALPLIETTTMQEVAWNFHTKAGTLTEDVKKAILLLETDAPRLRVAHQPNLLTGPNVTSLFNLLNESSKRIEKKQKYPLCQVYLAIDYDNVSDTRFRTRDIWDPFLPEKTLSLHGAVKKKDHGKVMYALSKPDEDQVNKWNEQLRQREQRFRKLPESVRVPSAMEIVTAPSLQKAYEQADSLVDFNMIVLSDFINNQKGFSTIFLPAHILQPALQRAYEKLLTEWPKLQTSAKQAVETLQSEGVAIKENFSRNTESFPIWYTCGACDHRVPLRDKQKDNRLQVEGNCPGCKHAYSFSLGTTKEPNLTAIADRMSPRVLFDNVLEDALGFVGGVDYGGSAEHILVTNMALKQIGDPHQPPHFLSEFT